MLADDPSLTTHAGLCVVTHQGVRYVVEVKIDHKYYTVQIACAPGVRVGNAIACQIMREQGWAPSFGVSWALSADVRRAPGAGVSWFGTNTSIDSATGAGPEAVADLDTGQGRVYHLIYGGNR